MVATMKKKKKLTVLVTKNLREMRFSIKFSILSSYNGKSGAPLIYR